MNAIASRRKKHRRAVSAAVVIKPHSKYVLAGDIGGTKTSLAIYAVEARGKLTLVREQSLASKRYNSVYEVLREFIRDGDERIDAASCGIAGPIHKGVVHVTNLPWKVESAEVARRIGCRRVRLLNDLEATAFGTLLLPRKDFHTLNNGKKKHGHCAVIAAGTGLGQAMLLWDGVRYRPSATEGGHADFAPRNDLEIELLRFLRTMHNRVSYERVLSGPGLADIFHFLDEVLNEPVDSAVRRRAREADLASVVGEAGLLGTCRTCERAVDMFLSIYGAQAGNLALTTMAIGGLYVGGGIVTKLLPKVIAGPFLDSFIAKEPFVQLMQEIPVHIILNPKTCQLGAARAAAELLEP